MSAIERLIECFETEVLCMKRKMTENERVFFIAGLASCLNFQRASQEQHDFDAFVKVQLAFQDEANSYMHPDSIFGKMHRFYCDNCSKGESHAQS